MFSFSSSLSTCCVTYICSFFRASQLKETDLDSFLEIDDDMIDSIELEMKMRLAELQKRYREKQRQLAKLTPKKLKDIKDTENKIKEETKQKTR